MKLSDRILSYMRENMTEVMHTTLNPDGPGVVRIHLIPPDIEEGALESSVAIINGQDVVPIGLSWSIILSEFIKQVNVYHGQAITDDDAKLIMDKTCVEVRKIYRFLPKRVIKRDIYTIMNSFVAIARGEAPDEEVSYLSMGEYAKYMKAPHRMDLLVSAMTKDGSWHCNQQCVHCYAAGQELVSEKELSTEEWKRIIDKCRMAGIPQVTFTGGEPTMRDDLVELIDHSRWFVTRLNTNGIKLTKELCEELVNASLDSCQITFYSCDEEIHNKLVGAPQYKNTLAGIENALAAGLNISINTPLCTLNKDYKKTLEFLHEKGVTYVTCSGLITTGNACGEESINMQLSKDEIKAVLKEAVDYCYSHDMEISFTSPGWIEEEFFEENGLSKPSCGACLSNMAVTPGGNVVPCQSYLSDKPLGNMFTDDWSKIWKNERTVAHREFSAKMTGLCPLRIKEGGERHA